MATLVESGGAIYFITYFKLCDIITGFLDAEAIRDTISRGVSDGQLAYVGKTDTGEYSPFFFEKSLTANDVEISEEMYLMRREDAEAYRNEKEIVSKPPSSDETKISVYPTDKNNSDGMKECDEGTLPETPTSGPTATSTASAVNTVTKLQWNGEVPTQKWMNFYTNVLSKFAAGKGLKLVLKVDVEPDDGISTQKVEETKIALQELGLEGELLVE